MRPILAAVVFLAASQLVQAQERPKDLARAVVDQINWARQDPKAAAAELRTWLPRFEGGRYLAFPGEPRLRTREGAAPVKEAIAFLEKQPPLPPLAWSQGLAEAAEDLARDQAAYGGVGHATSYGASPHARIERHLRVEGESGEVVTYGSFGDPPQARRAVLALIVDDGVADRGHRALLFDRAFRLAGAGWGGHPIYDRMAVVDFAERELSEPESRR